jgi:hypothetical protein
MAILALGFKEVEGVFKSWGYSGSHTLERLEKSSDVLRDRLF